MTVIRPNSISGVTSITAQSQSIEFYKSDGNLSGANLDGVNINTAGILTAANFKTGSSNLHSTGLTVGNNFLHTTGINVGTGATIHVPSSNVLTLGTNNNERLRIDSSGRALIGTTTEGHAEGDDLTIATSGVTGITIRSGTSSAGNIFFSDATSGSAERQGILRYDHADDAMKFNVNNSERLRITSAGYLNIGTDLTNSTYLVSSRGVGHNRVEIMSTDNNSAGIYLRTFNSGSQVSSATVRTDNSGNLQFYTAAGGSEGERLRITSGGDTTINGDLTVSSGTSGDAKLIIEADTDNNNESDNPTLVFKQDGGIEVSSIGHGLLSGDQNGLVLANSCSNGYMSFATGSTNGHTNATERLRIDLSGHVMIGTTTEGFATYGDQFTIANSGHCGMTIRSGTSNYGTIYFSDGDDGSADEVRGFIDYNHSNNQLQIGTNAATRLRIDSSGNVTKPSHCCFQAVINSGTHPTSGSYLVFGAVDVNIGNNYNSSNGIFTAPVAGVYLFHISAIAHNNTTTVYRYFLRINNGNTGSGNDAHLRLDMTNDDNDYGPNASYTYYKYMNANDTARVYWYTDIGSGTSYSNADYMKFAGHLVG